MTDAGYEVPPEALAMLAQTVIQALALRDRLLSVVRDISGGMFIGKAAASSALAGGFELALSSAAKTIVLLSHAERVGELISAVEDAVLASSRDSATSAGVAVVLMRACRLAAACAEACDVIPGEP